MIHTNQSLVSDPQGSAPDLTPLLDIIFIVLVFLLLTATIKLQSMEVTLPTSDLEAVVEVNKEAVTINILEKEPHWAIDGKSVESWESFKTTLIQTISDKEEPPVVIAADKTAEIQHIVDLLTFLQEQNISATQLLIDRKEVAQE
ncbi:biopolymer transporter ExbD [Psychromonas aquatilis]|uniref:Biopolymer transporter ExbD n=1 Tax=Psychromonas aquatilis TaxID=2005072 RepID=A0ABU9GMF8_9GAMM